MEAKLIPKQDGKKFRSGGVVWPKRGTQHHRSPPRPRNRHGTEMLAHSWVISHPRARAPERAGAEADAKRGPPRISGTSRPPGAPREPGTAIQRSEPATPQRNWADRPNGR